MVQADSGAIGGSTSAEFQVLVDSGEDAIVACDTCDYAANVEVATVKAVDAPDATHGTAATTKVHTPGPRHHRGRHQVPRRHAGADAQVAGLYVAGDTGRHGRRARRPRGEPGAPRARPRGGRGVPRERGRREEGDGGQGRLRGTGRVQGRVLVDRAAARVSNGVDRRQRDRLPPDRRRLTVATSRGRRRHSPGDDRRHLPRAAGGASSRSTEGSRRGTSSSWGPSTPPPWGRLTSTRSSRASRSSWVATASACRASWRPTIEQHNDENGILWPMSVAPYQVHLVTIGKDDDVLAEGARALRRRSRRPGSRSSGTTATSARG